MLTSLPGFIPRQIQDTILYEICPYNYTLISLHVHAFMYNMQLVPYIIGTCIYQQIFVDLLFKEGSARTKRKHLIECIII